MRFELFSKNCSVCVCLEILTTDGLCVIGLQGITERRSLS